MHPSWCDESRCTAATPDGVHKGVVHKVEDNAGRELLRWFLQAPNGSRPGVLLAASPRGPLDDVAAARFTEGARLMTRALSEAQAQW